MYVCDRPKMNTCTIQDSYHPLLSAVTCRQPPSLLPTSTRGQRLPWFRRQRVFPKSKGALMILVWNIIVGATYATVITGGTAIVFSKRTGFSIHQALYSLLGLFSFIATVQLLFYPLGGLIADIYCGRGRVIAISTVKICCGYGILLVLIVLFAKTGFSIKHKKDGDLKLVVPQYGTIGMALILFVAGFTGFQANAVQFGLDQLLDAPSEELSVFLHWYVWTDHVGQLIMGCLAIVTPCSKSTLKALVFSPIAFFIILTVTLIVSYYKREWFHSEPRTRNPYGMVYRVLKFVAGHDKPLRPSAFTYCDNEIPTRMDFAKGRFGGPFSTDTVEDVKTFLRILVMLLAIGPVYVLNVAVSYLFPFYGAHVGPTNTLPPTDPHSCQYLNWIMLESGNLAYLVSVLLLPPYIIFVLPCARKSYPKILRRLGIGIAMLLLAAATMTATQMAAHHTHHNKSNISCLFDTDYQVQKNFTTLNLHSWVLIFPNLISGIAVPLIYITILEFISAQSPHAMKGLLLGVFYAVRGLFTILGCSLVFPFANVLWLKQQGRLFDCGVSYYMSSTLLGVVGLTLFGLAARWYQYRERDDPPFGPMYAEECLQRQIQARAAAMEDSVKGNDARLLSNNSILDYGTTVGT